MKTCFKCGVCKPLSEYYKHAQMADGHLNKCKTCAKADANKHRADNLETVKAYDRSRSSLSHRVAARSAYAETDAYKTSHAKSLQRYRENNPEKHAAHTAVGNAVRDGRLVPWPVCAVPECSCIPEAHHPDYSRPLDVVWLCDLHHKGAHQIAREFNRANSSN